MLKLCSAGASVQQDYVKVLISSISEMNSREELKR
jgi:hypothetical protein